MFSNVPGRIAAGEGVIDATGLDGGIEHRVPFAFVPTRPTSSHMAIRLSGCPDALSRPPPPLRSDCMVGRCMFRFSDARCCGKEAGMPDFADSKLNELLRRLPEWIRRDLASTDASRRARAEDSLYAMLTPLIAGGSTAGKDAS